MAFQLNPDEPVGEGITRNLRAQIEKALKHVSAKRRPHQRSPSENEAILEVRKCFKRVRAALRLVRQELGDGVYHEENWCFRDAARPLTQIRDAQALVETMDKLAPKFAAAIGVDALEKIHQALLANQKEVAGRVLDREHAFGVIAEIATRALTRVADWKIDRDGWLAVETGLRRVYRDGHRALARAAETSTVANLHEWRKQAKYLWHHLQLLDARWTDPEKEFVDQTHHLSRLLGEDHDLAVLRETLAADPKAYGGHHVLKAVFTVIDGQREEQQQQAFALGSELYKDPPKAFASRIEALMNYEEVVA